MEPNAIKVLIIDDSQLVHSLLGKVFAGEADLRIVGDAYDGQEGVKLAKELAPDVIIMDINMPGMSGLEAIEEIMAEKPTPIIVFSSASKSIIDLSFKAIERGAVDLVEKPSAPDLSTLKTVIEEKLVRTIRTFADFKVIHRFRKHTVPARTVRHREREEKRARPPAAPAERRPTAGFFVAAVAASTGGPQMLRELLGHPSLAGLPAGIIVLQHLAEDFIEGFLDWLRTFSVLPVAIAGEDAPLRPGAVQVAPPGRHLGLGAEGRFIGIDQPPLYGIRPSADILFESLAAGLGPRLIVFVLSGMGSDGARALPAVKRSGGYVVSQDEESSLIFGMPKAAIETGLVDQVLPIRKMPEFLARYCAGSAAAHAG